VALVCKDTLGTTAVEEDPNQGSAKGGLREVAVWNQESPGKTAVGGRSFPDNASSLARRGNGTTIGRLESEDCATQGCL